MKKRYALLLLLLTFIVASCSDGGNNPDPLELSSVYVTNEGNYSQSNGSITSYDPETGETVKKVFEDVNDRPFAGIVQSSKIVGNLLYIVSNNANKIEVVNKNTLESVETIQLSEPPTAIEVVNETAYVTTLNYQTPVDKVLLVDLSTMEEMEKSIEVSSQPRDIIYTGSQLYVAINSSNIISVINPENNSVEQNITVGAGPSHMLIDNNNRIWVACNGQISYDESTEDKPGSVHVLNGQTGEVLNSTKSPDIVATPGYYRRLALNIDDAQAYFLNEGISVIDMNTMSISSSKLTNRSFYSIGFSSQQNRLYVGDSKGYSQDGQALIYNLQGTAVDSFNVGVVPNDFHFVNN